MNNFLEELRTYFEVTPREKVLEDWAKSADFDKIGPTVEEFLQVTKQYHQIISKDPSDSCSVGNLEFNPKFTSGFFMSNKNISTCKKLHFQF